MMLKNWVMLILISMNEVIKWMNGMLETQRIGETVLEFPIFYIWDICRTTMRMRKTFIIIRPIRKGLWMRHGDLGRTTGMMRPWIKSIGH